MIRQPRLPQTRLCPPLSEGQSETIEGQQLAHESLRGGHSDFNSGANIQNVAHQPPQRTFGPVGNPQHARGIGRVAVTLASVLFHDQGREGIGGLPGLGDADREHLGRQGRRCVAEFTRIKHSRGQAGHLLQQVGTYLGRMATGAAGQDLDALHTAVDLLIKGQGHQGSLGQVAGHPERGGLGLLMDLLKHEMAEAALVRHVLGATEQAGVALHPLTGGVVQLNAQGGQ